jgi:hypothetical protein
VKVGGWYSLPPGHIVVTVVTEMSVEDITPALARRSGFVGVVDLLKTAKHGPGRRVFLIEFRYEPPGRSPPPRVRPDPRPQRNRWRALVDASHKATGARASGKPEKRR